MLLKELTALGQSKAESFTEGKDKSWLGSPAAAVLRDLLSAAQSCIQPSVGRVPGPALAEQWLPW